MKNLLFLIFTLISVSSFGQAKLTQAQLDEYDKKLKANPAETVKQYTHKDFTFINGKGIRVGYNELVANYTYNKETLRKLSNVKIAQVNQTASVTGKVEHEWHPINDPSKVSKYTGMFTYVYVFDGSTWKLITAQHTDFIAPKTDDEVAIKNAIESETQSYLDGDTEKQLGYWSSMPSNEYNGQAIIPMIGQPYAKGESMTELIKTVKSLAKKQDVKVTREDYEVRINKDMAWATFNQKTSGSNGEAMKTERGTRILERINGDWKLVYVGVQGMK